MLILRTGVMFRLLVALCCRAGPAVAQSSGEWNAPETMSLVARAIAARQRAEPDSSLASYQTVAHGFVLFLAQAGREPLIPPRLVKADELEVEVYWQSPGPSKQVIRGWRDGRWLPTDIRYHRDHLGIVADNFGDWIRLGGGDEVRDVMHPLAPPGPANYDYRLIDSVRVRSRDTLLTVHELEVRPRDRGASRIVGTLSLDAVTGDLVRLRFGFTPAAYLDPSLEDITVVLENARVEERWWLPFRQEIEIRRRVEWLDFPARSIIRGRWEIGDYQLHTVVPRSVMLGPAIGGMRAPVDSGGGWTRSLEEEVAGAATPVAREDLALVRREIERITSERLTAPAPPVRLGITGVSDVLRVNRVQGLTLGAGLALRPSGATVVRPRLAYGTADQRFTGDVTVEAAMRGTVLGLSAGRAIRDLADRPVISGLMNSLLAQEGGNDYGDYVLLDGASLEAARRLGGAVRLRLSGGFERSQSIDAAASPATGRYRPNPPLGAGRLGVGRLALEYRTASADRTSGLVAEVRGEGGGGDRDYFRGDAFIQWRVPAGPGVADLKVQAGAGTADLPAYRTFALGGWGTLPGEPFREWGGLRSALVSLEYRLGLPVPSLPLGDFVSTGRTAILAPFLAVGAAAGIPGDSLPWRPTPTPRTVAGLALELFHQLLRIEGGVSLHTGDFGLSVDLSREWWDIL
ncbi:MAG: hypothetical protein OEW17_05545 [Gemmatimonadota bacterium]|nr:hypothetical protein [Gemmatimonadota bacterium]